MVLNPKKSMCCILAFVTILSPFLIARPLFREEIGVLTSLPLLRNVVEDLENARNNEECSLTLYFTKESHIHTLVNLVLLSGVPIANRRIPELDYCVRSLSSASLRMLTDFWGLLKSHITYV